MRSVCDSKVKVKNAMTHPSSTWVECLFTRSRLQVIVPMSNMQKFISLQKVVAQSISKLDLFGRETKQNYFIRNSENFI